MTANSSIKPQPEPGSVQDILHEFLSGASVRPGAPFSDPHVCLIQATRSATRTLRRAVFGLKPSRVQMTRGGVWAFSATQNQSEAVDPVVNAMNGGGHSTLDHALILDPMKTWGSQLARAALKRLPDATARLSELDEEAFALVADLPELLAIAMGEADCFQRMATHDRPGALLITNDHSPRNRAILAAARQMGISTAYLQHAAVGGIERPLDMDLALLQGRHSLDIYRSIGPVSARIELIGAPKIDVARRARIARTDSDERFVLFPGLFDDIARVQEIARPLRAAFPDAVIFVRRHPRDDRTDWSEWSSEVATLLPQDECPAMDILITCDLAIFDDSNVGLEAAALGVPVLCAPFKSMSRDQYGLSSTGVFDACKTDGADVVSMARAVLKGIAVPDKDALDYIFESLSSGLGDADKTAAGYLRKLARLD